MWRSRPGDWFTRPVLRRKVEAEAGIEVRSGVDLSGLIARSDGTVSTVTGLRTRDGEQLRADLVVDVCGRRSAAPRWLREIGVPPPAEALRPFGLHYFARHYRLHPGASYPSTDVPVGQVTPYGLFAAFGGDNGTFSLAGGLSKDDPHKAALRDGKVFDRVFSAIPAFSPWLGASAPITDVHLMAGLANRRRSLVLDGAPTVRRYILIGDASIYTNATFGQGIALGFWQAQRLAHLSSEIGQNNDALVRELEDWTDRTLGPRFEAQSESDESMVQTMRAGIHGAPLPEPEKAQKPLSAVGALSTKGDELATAALARVQNLLVEPADLLADPSLAERVRSFLATDPPLGGGIGPLLRSEFEALVR
jgi:2-polyprenyl-6-methoxyphenol hydroxylase-like FAD-dependent oxidoreductase